MTFFGAILITICCVALIVLPRRWAMLALIAGVAYIPQAQATTVGGFNFFAQRIILLAGIIRIIARGELRRVQLNKIDWAFILFSIVATIAPAIRQGVLKESLGNFYNYIFSYFLCRCLITNLEEFEELLPKVALLLVPEAICMVDEMATGRNFFTFLTGHEFDWTREGRLRCVGSFRGPHTAGVFGAMFMPVFVWLYFKGAQRWIAVVGLLAIVAITYTSNSSGPLMCFTSGMVGLAFWKLRHHMRRVRIGLVIVLVVLAFVMNAPIWYLISKISAITGGDGWSRSYLMEQCYKHLSDWWLMGTDNTSSWAATEMPWGGADLCNLYVSCAADGGMAGLILIILLLVRCFSYLGRALKLADEMMPDSVGILWCLGCVLFAHVCTLFSVTYWDQLFVVWWGLLAIISSVTSSFITQYEVAEEAEEAAEDVAEENLAGNPAF